MNMERDKRKKSKMPCLFGGNGENSKRKTVQPRSPSNGATDQNLFMFEAGQGSSKQCYGYGTPMKTLLAKEMSNETSVKKRSPSIIAKLMGLDGLPSPQPIHRQPKKLSDSPHKTSVSPGGKRNENKKITMEQQQFKDVYEDPEASHVANQRYSSQSSAKRRSTKQEFGYIQERCDEMLRESNSIKSKFERVDSNSDLMLSFLQKPGSLFVKHLHDQQRIHSDSLCNQITVLKPSNSFRRGVHGKVLKEDRETLNYRVSEDQILGYSHRPSRVRLDRKEVTAISPTKIIVLKPNIAKIYNSPNEFRKNKESECFNRHKCREAREIARQITSRIKDDFESGHVSLHDSGFRRYATEPEMTAVPSRNSFDWNDRPKHSPYNNMSESSVIREAKKRMSRRWKTHGYKDSGMVGKASTLEEMLSVPKSKMVNDEFVSNGESGISSRDDWRDGYLRTTSRSRSRSRSLPPSFQNQNHRICEYYEPHNDKSKGIKEDLPSKSSRYDKRCQSSCNLEYANFLPESRSSRNPSETYFENEDPDEEQTRMINILDVTKISSESSNKLSSGTATCRLGDADSYAVDEDSSNSQEPSTAKSGGSASIQLSGPEPESSEGSKEVEFDECGEISVIEVPLIEDASSGSDCFEGVNSRLHALRKQLNLLRMESESGSTYEDVEPLSDSENWESSYLTDILNGSGFYDNDPYTFMTTWYAIDCPINPSLFDHLEKTYSRHTTVPRPERHLLYDRINEAFLTISKMTLPCWWARRGIQMTLTEIGFEDQLHRLLAKQETEANEEFEEVSIDKDRDWFEAVKEVEIVGKRIAEMLVNDLVLEIVSVL